MPINTNKYRTCLLLLLLAIGLHAVAYAQNNYATRIKCVVIDPGHGGHDPGTVSTGAKYKEKDIVLSVGLKLGSMIKSRYPHIKIIYTRSSDKFVPLAERSDIANRNNADLFISIHVNATKSTGVSGTETFVMGMHKSESNFELCKAENSVIALEDNYETKYEGFNPNSPESYIIFSLLQNTHLEQSIKLAEIVQNNFKKGPIYSNRGVKQGGLIVLWRSTMPAILTEIGFLSNSKDRAAMITKDGQTAIARRLFNAFCQYKDLYEGNTEDNPKPATATVKPAEPANKPATGKPATGNPSAGKSASGNPSATKNESADANAQEYYSIQIFSVGKVLAKNSPEFKGRKDISYIKASGMYKYMVGKYSTREKAALSLPSVRKAFPGAFIVHIKEKQIVK